MRYRLGLYENIDIRREIEEKVFLKAAKTNADAPTNMIYPKKLASIINLLEKLIEQHVTFEVYDEAALKKLMQLKTITPCYNNCKNKLYCRPEEEGAEGIL